MKELLIPAAAFLIAFVSALWLHPKVVEIARRKQITDKPDRRKLQREPVPVLGGVVVFFGMVMGMGFVSPHFECPDILLPFTLMLLMLYTGSMDDVLGLSPGLRFAIEIFAALLLIFEGGMAIDDFHGLWGLHTIPLWIAGPLTVVSVVGIINSINLIDGVNGLSSGFCIFACSAFCIYFHSAGDMASVILAITCVGALIPFFIHNVFGHRMKMFIGDGGTLLMGMILSIFVLRTLDADNPAAHYNEGLIPFTLAVLSVPVFDTLRVMTMRILRGGSPFLPDKTHLHHAFIEVGFSHLWTTLSILFLDLLVTVVWFILFKAGAPVDMQLYAVLTLAAASTAGVYLALRNICSRRAAEQSRN